jgi:hypothetical protein
VPISGWTLKGDLPPVSDMRILLTEKRLRFPYLALDFGIRTCRWLGGVVHADIWGRDLAQKVGVVANVVSRGDNTDGVIRGEGDESYCRG